MNEEAVAFTVGRRKTSVARVKIVPGTGQLTVNRRSIEQYFPRETYVTSILKPIRICECEGKYDVQVNVRGGGMTGQAGAISLGIARALTVLDPAHRRVLKRHGLLTRDPRMVERKKYGRPGARKRFQFSKR